MNDVVVAKDPAEDAMTNCGMMPLKLEMENFAHGDDVPMPTFPSALIRKSEEDAVPRGLVEFETSKSASCEPYEPCTVSFAYGADIDVVAILPIPTFPDRKEMS